LFDEFAEFGGDSSRGCEDEHLSAICNELPEGIGKVTVPAPKNEVFDALRGIIDEHVPADFHIKITLPVFQIPRTASVEFPKLAVKFFKMSGELAGMLDTSIERFMIFTGLVVRSYP
jgi:hypothetical protein